ncbi:unnamed protein product [Moneuplotes crassus]|uniref:Polyhydroxybutyrate depolymerase n=1 Tax=Euplotes crassus TaxID=5936 RepID=A0AAD1XJK7_EUPCR|nr:unnamed protein product [Moneuplotes crassus]|mmetsp:Transcript_25226/g.24995  ORF Transcript_25226/g.24995 Transcript_25226/m.24995 type:complete len:341 (-) Transcript_25226:66-1088(-)
MKLLVSILAIFLAVSAAVTVGISDDITVSGLSSGAFMAVQMHVANSATIKGAGVFAGGPFYCAQGQVATALTTCMSIGTGINLAGIKQEISTQASKGKVDDPSNLSGSKVFVFSGTADSTVNPNVNHATVDFYNGYNADIKEKFDLNAGHTMPTVDKGISCGSTQSPYIGKCDYNGAFEALKHLHPDQVTNEPGSYNPSNLFKVTQSGASGAIMGSQAYLYVPEKCQSAEAGCSLHVVFHGCQQTTADIGEKYETDTGYNEVAETNDMVILYPQATKQILKNPNGCWDWWGYTDGTSFLPTSKTYHTKEGKQMKVVKSTIDSISNGTAKLTRVEDELIKE